MTESDWASAANPSPLLRFAGPQLSDRKLRLAVVGCLWRRPELFSFYRAHRALTVATQAADSPVPPSRLAIVAAQAEQASRDPGPEWRQHAAQAAFYVACTNEELRREAAYFPATLGGELIGVAALRWAARAWAEYDAFQAGGGQLRQQTAEAAELAAQAHVVRCVVGNPFAYTIADPAWLTSDVLRLASAIDKADDFASLPVLADALEEAGCDDPAVLHHARHHRDHARGCWVLDLLLGRA